MTSRSQIDMTNSIVNGSSSEIYVNSNVLNNNEISGVTFGGINNMNINLGNVSLYDILLNGSSTNITISGGDLALEESEINPSLSLNISGNSHVISTTIFANNNTINVNGGDLLVTGTSMLLNTYKLNGNVTVTSSVINSEAINGLEIDPTSQNPNKIVINNTIINIEPSMYSDPSYRLINSVNTSFVTMDGYNTIEMPSVTDVDMNKLTYNKDWFGAENTNIIVLNNENVTISNYVDDKYLNLTSSLDVNIQVAGNNVNNSQIFIYGNKVQEIERSLPVGQGEDGLTRGFDNAINTNVPDDSTAVNSSPEKYTFTFEDVVFRGLILNGTSYITYGETVDQDCGCENEKNVNIGLTNVDFYINPGVKSVDTLMQFGSETLSYDIYAESDGTYLLGEDPLMIRNNFNTLRLNSNSLTDINLYGTDSSSLFNGRLQLYVDALNSSNSAVPPLTDLSATIKALGLDIYDQRNDSTTYSQNMIYGGELNISDLSTELNTVNITVDNSTQKVDMTFTGMTFINSNNNSYIHINNDNNTSPDNSRIIRVDTGNTFSGSNQYFIHNEGTLFLDVEYNPSSLSIQKNYIYWPTLKNVENSITWGSYPLSGNGVKFAESWIKGDYTSIENRVWSSDGGLVAIWDIEASKSIIYNVVYSKEALGLTPIANTVTRNLNKQFTNANTRHTGKIVYGVNNLNDSVSDTDTNLQGKLFGPISLSSTSVILMPPLNEVQYSITYPSSFESYNKIYEITNNQYIGENGGSTVYDYLQNNIKSYIDLVHTNMTNLSDAFYQVDDGKGNMIDIVNGANIKFSIEPVIGTRFDILNNVTFDLTSNNTNIVYDNSTSTSTIGEVKSLTYYGVDNSADYSTATDVHISDDPIAWTTKTISVSADFANTYTTEGDPSLTITINNSKDDEKVYGIRLENSLYNYNIDATLTSTSEFDNILTFGGEQFRHTSNTSIDQIHLWNEGTGNQACIGLLFPSITTGSYNINSLITNISIPLLDDDENAGSESYSVIITKMEWDSGDNVWIVAPYQTVSSSDIDKVIRLKIEFDLRNLENRYYGRTYNLHFDIRNPWVEDESKHLSVIVPFTIPFVAQVVNSGGPYVENEHFSLTLQLTTKLENGEISFGFNDPGTNPGFTNGTIVDFTNASVGLIPVGSLNTSIVNVNSLNNTYEFSYPNHIIGNFSTELIINSITENGTEITLTSAPTSNKNKKISSQISYLENNQLNINVVLGKILNPAGEEEIQGFDVTNSMSNNTIQKESVTHSDGNNYLVPASFTTQLESNNAVSEIASAHLYPFNKFTRYFISVNTNSLGIDVTGNVLDLEDTNISIQFKFTNDISGSTEVTDIELLDCDGNVISSTLSINNLLSQNRYNDEGEVIGNNLILLRRKVVPNTEQSYTTLYVWYKFNDIANTNYQNLNSSYVKLGAISYNHIGVTSMKVSELAIGNFKLIPSGDGKRLILVGVSNTTDSNYATVEAGDDPMSIDVPMDKNEQVYDNEVNQPALNSIVLGRNKIV
jgi:hypothetical protein